jgi:hypothetical protein
MAGAKERLVDASIIGADKLKAQFDSALPKVKQQLATDLNKLGFDAANKLRQRIAGPLPPSGYPARRTSHMMTGISVEKASANMPFVNIRSKEKYFGWVNEGTPPHGVSKEGQAAIARWSIAHPYSYQDKKSGKTVKVSPEASAYLISRAIKKRGSPPRHITDAVIPGIQVIARLTVEAALGRVNL